MSYQIPDPCEPIGLGEFFLEDRRFPAVYLLYYRGEVVYVGQSKTLKFRIDGHMAEGKKLFDAVAFIRCPINRLTKIESHYIRQLAPKYNACGLSKKVRQRESWMRDDARYRARRSRFECGDNPPRDADGNLVFVNAAECEVEQIDLGELLGVSDEDVRNWVKEGQELPTNLVDMFGFMVTNRDQVRKAQERFDNL